MAVKKPASKSTLKRKVAVKKPLAAKKRIIAKPIKTKKLAVKKLSYKKTPIKRVSTAKKVKLSKPFGIAVMLGGVAVLVLLFVFGLPTILNPDSGKKPVLGVTINSVPVNPAFTDPNFYACVIDRLNTAGVDGKSDRTYTHYASNTELAKLTKLDCNGYNKAIENKIKSSAGLEKLTSLDYLILSGNQLTSIDVSQNKLLKLLFLTSNYLSAVDFTKNTALTGLGLSYNQITSINVTKNTALRSLELSSNKISSINISENKALMYLKLDDNKLENLDLSKNVNLKSLDLSRNSITEIDVTKNTSLENITFIWTPLSNLDVTKNIALKTMLLHGASISSIDVTKNINLQSLVIRNSRLSAIDISNNKALLYLDLAENNLSSLEIRNNTLLIRLDLGNNLIKSIDISTNVLLEKLDIRNNQLNSLSLLSNNKLQTLILYNNLIDSIKAISSTEHIITSDNKSILTYTKDYVKFMAGVVPANSLVTTGVYRNGKLVKSGKLANGDILRVRVKDFDKDFDYTIRFMPTTISYGNLTSSIDQRNNIFYVKPLSLVRSVDLSQITVKGDVMITTAYLANSKGNKKISGLAILVNGDKLIIKLSDGTIKEFIVKTAWSW